jgi:hypothetical protein
MFKVYGSDRYTRDIDALAQNIDIKKVESEVLKDIEKDLSDGFWFGDAMVEELVHQGEYSGLRFDLAFQIGEPASKKIHKLPRIHFDVGIGDSVDDKFILTKLQPLVEVGDEVSWRVSPPEFIYSEKLETLIKRGSLNSRAKDDYDLRILFKKCSLSELKSAIEVTFGTRKKPVPVSFESFLSNLNFQSIKPSWQAQKFGNFDDAIDGLKEDFSKIDKFMVL